MDEYLKFLRGRVGDALVVAPVAGMAARDGEGRLLLQQRAGEGTWGLPGGWMAPGESAHACAAREALEETGWVVEVTGLLGVYTDPATHTFTYPNGHRAQFVALVFEGRAVRRAGEGDHETSAQGFFARTELPSPLHGPDRDAIHDALSGAPRPFVR
ncbi:MAG: NUDIX domain-containing protein [Polyangiales bacterium]